MQLTYRGITFQATQNDVETVETNLTAKFRGTVYHVRRPVTVPNNTLHRLVYRGVGYTPEV
jgi:Domain of unknown function (DUF4278)